MLACERRRISGCHLVLPKNNVCEPKPENDFCDIEILSQSQFSSSSPRATPRGIRCEEHSSFILSWNLIGRGETKVITSHKSFPGSGSQTLFFGGTKWQPEIRLRSQATVRLNWLFNCLCLYVKKVTSAYEPSLCIRRLRPQYERQSKLSCPTETTRW